MCTENINLALIQVINLYLKSETCTPDCLNAKMRSRPQMPAICHPCPHGGHCIALPPGSSPLSLFSACLGGKKKKKKKSCIHSFSLNMPHDQHNEMCRKTRASFYLRFLEPSPKTKQYDKNVHPKNRSLRW